MRIPFNLPYLTGNELGNIKSALESDHLSGNGPFTKRAHGWLEASLGVPKALLTHSATGALEMAALLSEVGPGDEIVMPSFTFVSTANAFVLRGAVPVFVDVRPDTLNLDERKVEAAITSKTRAIVVVHYAGVACEMDAILEIALRHGLLVIEDAAQGIGASYKGRPLGTIGQYGALSFHETKNVISGEGGALLVNVPESALRAEMIWEKGTNRSQFFRGEVDKYSWREVGSSFLPGEITAAFLCAQLDETDSIIRRRVAIWDRYHRLLEPLEREGRVRRPIVPDECAANGHLYYLLTRTPEERDFMLDYLRSQGIGAVFHYVPLHEAEAGRAHARIAGPLEITENLSRRLVRLPLWLPMTDEDVESVAAEVGNAIEAFDRRS